MKHHLLCMMALVALVALVATVRADDEKKTDSPDTYRSLTAEFSTAKGAALTAYRAAKSDKERQQRLAEYRLVPSKFAGRFLKFAEANADDAAAYDALVWVMSNDQGKIASKAVPAIVANHIDNPKIGQLCKRLSRSSSPAVKKLMQAVIESSTNVDAKGQATYALAKAMIGRSGKGSKKAEVLLQSVIDDYNKVDNGSLAKTATRDLFEIQHLSIGCEAPAITQEDIDGVEFSLVDYRGKVVVLDFWGDW